LLALLCRHSTTQLGCCRNALGTTQAQAGCHSQTRNIVATQRRQLTAIRLQQSLGIGCRVRGAILAHNDRQKVRIAECLNAACCDSLAKCQTIARLHKFLIVKDY
jgi:hypothetical protein